MSTQPATKVLRNHTLPSLELWVNVFSKVIEDIEDHDCSCPTLCASYNTSDPCSDRWIFYVRCRYCGKRWAMNAKWWRYLKESNVDINFRFDRLVSTRNIFCDAKVLNLS